MSYDLDELKDRLKERADEVVDYLYGDCSLKRVGNNLFAGKISGAPSSKGGLGSFCITVAGPKKGAVRDFGAESGQKYSLLDCWMERRGLGFIDAVREAAQFVGLAPLNNESAIDRIRYREPKAAMIELKKWEYPAPCLERTRAGRRKRLLECSAAMDYLINKRGLTEQTIERFSLGLNCPEKLFGLLQRWRAEGKPMPEAQFGNIVCPVKGIDGQFYESNTYLAIPGYAEQFGLKESTLSVWGDPDGLYLTYFADAYRGQPYLFVAEGQKDVWRHYQALKSFGYDQHFLIVSSTSGSAFPLEFGEASKSFAPKAYRDFFSKFKLIVLGQDNDKAGEEMASRWAKAAGRNCIRMKVPLSYNNGAPGADWTDFWNKGGSLDEFRSIFANGPQVYPSPGNEESF